MFWPSGFTVIWSLVHNAFFVSWFFGAAGIITAILLHRKDKKSRIWPALCAFILWFACEVALDEPLTLEYLVLYLGCFAFCYGAAWLIMDIVYWLKRKKEK